MINLTTKNKFKTENDVDELINNGKFKLTREDWYHVALAAYQVNTLQDYVQTTLSYNRLQEKPSINGVVLEGNKTNEELGIYSAGIYSTLAKLAITAPEVRNTTILSAVVMPNSKPYTFLKHGDLLVDGNGTIGFILSVDVANNSLSYNTFYYADYRELTNKPTLNGKIIQGNLTTADFGIKDGEQGPQGPQGEVGESGTDGNIIYHTDLMMDGYVDYATNPNLQYISTIKVDYSIYERAPIVGDYIIAQAFAQNDVYGLFKINLIAKNSSEIECYYCTEITRVTGRDGRNGAKGIGWHSVNSIDLTANEDGTFAYNNVPNANDIYSVGSLLLDETSKVYKVTSLYYKGEGIYNLTLEYYMTLAAKTIPAANISAIDTGYTMLLHESDPSYAVGDTLLISDGRVLKVSNVYDGGETVTYTLVPITSGSGTITAEDLPKMNYFSVSNGTTKRVDIQSTGIYTDYRNAEIGFINKNETLSYTYPDFDIELPIVAGKNVTFEKDETNQTVKINATDANGTYIYAGDIAEETSELDKANMFTTPQGRDFIDGDIIISTNGIILSVSGGTTDTLIYVEYAGKIEPSIDVEDLPNMNYFDASIGTINHVNPQPTGIYINYQEAEIEFEDKNGVISYKYPDFGIELPIVAGKNVTFEVDDTNSVVKINSEDGLKKTEQINIYDSSWTDTVIEDNRITFEYSIMFEDGEGNATSNEIIVHRQIPLKAGNGITFENHEGAVRINASSGDENAFTSLASGQPIEKIVFNPNVSIEKMTNYLASLPYGLEMFGVDCVTRLLGLDNRLSVYAFNFNVFASTMGTSGYGIGVIEESSESTVMKQAVFVSEYNENNLALINSIKDENYTVNYTEAGWLDTNDYVLDTSTTHTIYSVHDNKVSAFIGRDTRLWDVLSMFSLASAEGVSF